MKKAARLALCLSLLGAGVTGCIKDEYGGRGNATVTMTFTTRAVATDASADGQLEDNEQMRTLRVIVARHETNEILFNNVYDIEPEEKSKTITYSELTVEQGGEDFDFYAIANEAGFVTTGELNNINTAEELLTLKDRILTKDFNVKDPAVMIPQTAFATFRVAPNGDTSQTILLEFVVAKVYVGFINQTGAEQTISDLTLLNSDPEQGYLFGLGAGRIPDNISSYEDLLIENSVVVPANATADTPGVYAYLYPGSSTGDNAYVLQGTWNGSNHWVDDETITSDQKVISELKRGQQLNIIITLIGGEHEYAFYTLVNSWGEKEMNIPPFE